MTDSKEIIAYIVAHLAGYLASTVISQAVLVPMLMQTELMRTAVARFGVFFLLYLIVQTAVFFGFIAIRGRRTPGGL